MLLFLFCIICSSVSSHTEIKMLKLRVQALYQENALSQKTYEQCLENLDYIKNAVDDANIKMHKDKGYKIKLENIVGYIPLIDSKDNLNEKQTGKLIKDALYELSQNNLRKAYAKLLYVANNQNLDPCTHYYWMGMVAMQMNNHLQAFLHFSQFYKSMHIYKVHKPQIWKQHQSKMPRSITNMLECLFVLKYPNKALSLLEYFNDNHSTYRSTMKEKAIIQHISKADL